ncbi:uncharacterized protein JKF63_07969 [Porcisia hertigi]|uniref:Uncharacterized protein n=1 Tax=Porcisia hertigi TaxID=2761500 RepID=A0A836KV77_9TRYP|nr:hypothetical protein JKF63_07969 [Porcisia hertigi]
MPPAIAVHPSVLLSIVDHVTRVGLQHQKQGSAPGAPAVSAPTPAFLPIAGLLMGETKSSCSVDGSIWNSECRIQGTTTTLSASFELPVRLLPMDEVVADVALSGDVGFLQHLLDERTDWQAAQQHREQLSAVMPEMGVVGCYVVCVGSRQTSTQDQNGDGGADAALLGAGSAVKRARGEAMLSSDGMAVIANCVRQQLCRSALVPLTAPGFVLMVVYDGEVTSVACGTDTTAADSQQSPTAARLPFECLYVPVTTPGDVLPMEGVTVCPADMEWIALVNETVTPSYGKVTPAAISAVVKPNLLQRLCSAAQLTFPAPSRAPRELETTRNTSVTLSQNCRAAQELVGSLRLIMRLFADTTALKQSATAAAPNDVELLRTVATCLRNVPDRSPPQPHDDRTPSSEPPTEEVLIAVLALELQCALHLRSLRKAQQRLRSSHQTAMTALHSKAPPSKATKLLPSTEGH